MIGLYTYLASVDDVLIWTVASLIFVLHVPSVYLNDHHIFATDNCTDCKPWVLFITQSNVTADSHFSYLCSLWLCTLQ